MTDPVAARQAAIAAERRRLAEQRQRREAAPSHGTSGFVIRKWRWLGVNGAAAVSAVQEVLEELQQASGGEGADGGGHHKEELRKAVEGSPGADTLLPAVGALLRQCTPTDVLRHLRTLHAAGVEWLTPEGTDRLAVICSTAPSLLLARSSRSLTGGPAYSLFTSVAMGGAVPVPRTLLPEVLRWAPLPVVDDLIEHGGILPEDDPWAYRGDDEALYLRARLVPGQVTRDEARALDWTWFLRREEFVSGEEPDTDGSAADGRPDVWDLLFEASVGDATRLQELDAALPQEQRIQLRNLKAGSHEGNWPRNFLADRGLWALMSTLWDPQSTVDPRLSDFHAWTAVRRAYDLVIEGRVEEAGRQSAAFDRPSKPGKKPPPSMRGILPEALNIAAYAALAREDLPDAEALTERAVALTDEATGNLRLIRVWRSTPKNSRDPLTNPYLDLGLPHGSADWETRYRELVRESRFDTAKYARLNMIRGRLDEARRNEAGDAVFFRLPLTHSVYEAPDDVPRSIVPPLEPLPRRTPATSGADMEAVRARAAVELLQDFRTTPPRLDRHRSR
ncbi:hypothetical protein OHB37_27815 [Streptomyces albidoflavus]|uniref:hypothetical protein n=1 Tax=Streptomyces TaxID=1883 RepID=UPI001BEC1880|nr:MULTISPECIES: hypothetical protein [unclassified Streptomyces]MBT2876480.1 hypothetical protein [Streptomyces sp. McG6]MBT2883200.1 hypothetical protein [Streptomyces sp. McG5]MBT2889310.1 hypothetical protein [Streptomyces sp. McG2]WSB17737.1 hypothetical protein OHB37_27815 [Streptomyces albidoflavus]